MAVVQGGVHASLSEPATGPVPRLWCKLRSCDWIWLNSSVVAVRSALRSADEAKGGGTAAKPAAPAPATLLSRRMPTVDMLPALSVPEPASAALLAPAPACTRCSWSLLCVSCTPWLLCERCACDDSWSWLLRRRWRCKRLCSCATAVAYAAAPVPGAAARSLRAAVKVAPAAVAGGATTGAG